MCKKLRGYFSIEASVILPMVLFLYLMIILAALFMYCRCAISQDAFLLSMRAGRFTLGENEYGEVIYGEEKVEKWAADDYVQERLMMQKNRYPFYPHTGGICETDTESVNVRIWNKGYEELLNKQTQKINPVMLIREGRKC